MDRLLDQLARRLLIQCRPSQAEALAEIAAAHDSGLVITGATPESTVQTLRRRGFDGPILCDANRYAGRRRVSARRGIHPAWCRRQQALGLVALTDSGYLEARDWQGLRTILRAAATQRGAVVAMLPLSARWFATRAVSDALAGEVNTYGVPVAVAVEHPADPFGVQYVLRHFLGLVRATTVPVLLLRCDVSAIGALCHGVHAAAIGTTSGLRHLYPLLTGGRPRFAGVSVFVRHLLSYHRLDTCDTVLAGTPDSSQFWLCDCDICGGTTPARLRAADDPRTVALHHSLHAQLLLHREIFGRPRTPDQLVSSWHETCSHALFVHRQVADHVGRWHTPLHLKTWYAVTDDPLNRADIPRQPARRLHPSPQPSD
ncbi:hypothetical protein [Saccharomonospora xinjiangensis]|uniref:Uncharacterized protein n=1 Tax=Saccharomonospora xinjiangensis XJ-54 TaxID=882086 RepID=I0UWR7_9PSEU|nr:hypothetical protein [Saccharomonospora xinjiangensis]EID52320.1 hypothetical protein SacxiDRAFT_0031 [Saccharomonospora xinjiangensis XJ-54]